MANDPPQTGIAEVSRALDDQAFSTAEAADTNEDIDRKVSGLQTTVAELTTNR